MAARTRSASRSETFSLIQTVEALLDEHAGDDNRLLALKVTTQIPHGELTDALTQALLIAIPVIRHSWSLRAPGRKDREADEPRVTPPTFGTGPAGEKYASPAAAMTHSRPEFQKRWGLWGARGEWVSITVATRLDLEHAIAALNRRARTSQHRAQVLEEIRAELDARDVRTAGDLPRDVLSHYYAKYRAAPVL